MTTGYGTRVEYRNNNNITLVQFILADGSHYEFEKSGVEKLQKNIMSLESGTATLKCV